MKKENNKGIDESRRKFFLYWIGYIARNLRSADNLAILWMVGQYLSDLEKKKKMYSEEYDKGG